MRWYKENMQNRKITMHLLMVVLIMIWTLDAVAISVGVRNIPEMALLCMKYLAALPVILLAAVSGRHLEKPKKKDLPMIFISAIVGNILYFGAEYTAILHLPISISTVVVGILPAASYLTDCFIMKKPVRLPILLAVFVSLIGLGLVVGSRSGTESGDLIGYICCFLCIAIYILYGWLLRFLDTDYHPVSICLYQMVIAVVLLLPMTVSSLPLSVSTHDFIFCVVIAGILSSGIGYMIEVRGLIELGTTISGVYINLLPVFTAAAGVLFLNETMSALQIFGSLLVIACSIYITLQNDV
ncbi:MAG: DMT family transporter [Erysipelotrichaceae bacterium]|nr:DMT family transporter [Erysipelotrichaceae bacterium]